MIRDTDREMAEVLLDLILTFQETLPVGSELIATASAESPDDETDEEALRRRALRHVVSWASRDFYSDIREGLLQEVLAQVKVTLGSPGRDRREAIDRFKAYMATKTATLLEVILAHQEQGPSPIS
jgi:hypothetical protein